MLLLARVGGGGDDDHDRDHPESKQGASLPSLEGFSWRTPSAASSALRGLTRRHSPSEKPRLIELAGSCFTLVPSLPFLRQPSMTAFLHFTIRQLPSGGRGVEEEEEAEQQLAVISPLSSAKEEGGWLNLDRSTGLGPGAPSRLTDFLYKCKCGDGKTTGECQKARVVRPEHSLDLRYGQHREPHARGQGAARGPRAPLLHRVS